MKEIEQITEAFSMQPRKFYVGQKYDGVRVSKIIKEKRYFNGDNKPIDYYVGKDENGTELFEFRSDSVNVEYFVTEGQKNKH